MRLTNTKKSLLVAIVALVTMAVLTTAAPAKAGGGQYGSSSPRAERGQEHQQRPAQSTNMHVNRPRPAGFDSQGNPY